VLVLALKLLLAPGLVVASTVAGRRWGVAVAGTLVALPVVAGPILLVAHVEQGPAFAATAARSALLGIVSLAVFAVVLARLAARLPWPGTLALSWAACLVVDLLVVRWHVGPALGLAVAVAGCVAGTALLPYVPPHAASPGVPAPSPPRWDLPARAAATAALVLAVTGAAATLGPAATGVLAPFPVATSVVAAFVLAQHGAPATIAAMRGLLGGLVGFAVFCTTVAVLADEATTWFTYTAALVLALATQLAVHAVVRARACRAVVRHPASPRSREPAPRP
jgi:hypothetical protein